MGIKFRIIQKSSGVFIPQIKKSFFDSWENIDNELCLWVIEASHCKFKTFAEANKIIEEYKLKNIKKEDKTIKYYKMKVEIKDNTVIKEELPFPKLMISKDEDEWIVFFIENKKGFRIDNNHFFSENWKMSLFIDFEGEITLKNK